MSEKSGYEGKLTNKGTQVVPALHSRPNTPSPQKITGKDLRAGKGK